MKYLVVIPARGGSKGIPNKNIKLLHNKPLIHYTIEAAQAIFDNAAICVSTDSPAIQATAQINGLEVPFLRPDALATDTAGTYEVLLHAIDYYEMQGQKYDALVLLQPTSPFRTSKHIAEAINCYQPNLEMLVSVKETDANPYYVLFEENEQGYLEKSKKGNFTRRQDCPKVYEYNGAIYIMNIQALKKRHHSRFKKIGKYLMPADASLDIDTPLDWAIAEFLMTKSVMNA